MDAIVAIVFAAAATEAFLSDLVEVADMYCKIGATSDFIRNLVNVLSRDQDMRMRSQTKLHCAAVCLQGKAFETGKMPYQDFAILIELRNALVHLKPEKTKIQHVDDRSTRESKKGKKLLKKLCDRKLVASEEVASITSWKTLICTCQVAEWAYNSAIMMATALVEMIPQSEFRSTMEETFLEFIKRDQ